MKNAMEHISRYMHACVTEAVRRGFDGVVCGHIHHAEINSINGILYCNTGDWVENCTALTEERNGKMSIIRWIEHSVRLRLLAEGNTVHVDVARKVA
jgi:UDP-2,3-diacylglucosamine pyrophosphatase LpxH